MRVFGDGRDELLRSLSSGSFLTLYDLFYRDSQNRFVLWSEWDPRLEPIAYINPKFVLVVMPFAVDPFKAVSGT
jgi:hypothetical protein